MTDRIAEIRARLDGMGYAFVDGADIKTLLTALDAAQAERDRLKAALASRIELHDYDGRNLLNAHREIERLDQERAALKEKLDEETTWKLQFKGERDAAQARVRELEALFATSCDAIVALEAEKKAAFRAGAEAMREKAATLARERLDAQAAYMNREVTDDDVDQVEDDLYASVVLDQDIRALPLPEPESEVG